MYFVYPKKKRVNWAYLEFRLLNSCIPNMRYISVCAILYLFFSYFGYCHDTILTFIFILICVKSARVHRELPPPHFACHLGREGLNSFILESADRQIWRTDPSKINEQEFELIHQEYTIIYIKCICCIWRQNEAPQKLASLPRIVFCIYWA